MQTRGKLQVKNHLRRSSYHVYLAFIGNLDVRSGSLGRLVCREEPSSVNQAGTAQREDAFVLIFSHGLRMQLVLSSFSPACLLCAVWL